MVSNKDAVSLDCALARFRGEVMPASGSQNFATEGPSYSERMRGQCCDLTEGGLRFVEDAELAQDRRAVVVDSFAGKSIIGVESVDAAQRDLDASPGSRQSPPWT